MSVQRQINWQEAISAWVSYDEPDSQKDRSEWSIIRILEQEAERLPMTSQVLQRQLYPIESINYAQDTR